MSKQSALDELLSSASADKKQETQQLEPVQSKQELYMLHREAVFGEMHHFDERTAFMLQVILGMKPDGNPLPGFDVEEDFRPEASEELIQRLQNANKALGITPAASKEKSKNKKEKKPTASNREFSLDPRDWGLFQWLPAILGVLVMLGIASATKDWFVQDWVKVTNDTLSSVLTVLWVGVWLGIGFFGGPALVQFVRSRFGRSDSN